MSKTSKIEAEIAEYEALLKDSSVPQDEKDFAKEEIADLKKQLEKLDSKPTKTSSKKKLSVTDFRLWGTSEEGWFIEEKETGKQLNPINFGKKSWETKKEAVSDLEKYLKKGFKKSKKEKKPAKPANEYKYKGKSIKELSELECTELLAEIKARREKATKSSEKSKSKPVVEKVAANVATAVKQVIENVPAKDIDKTEIAKFKRIEKAAEAFVKEMKSILGSDWDKEAVQDEFAQITKLIEQLRKKYAK